MTDSIVIGGGLIGMLTALALRQRGGKVTIVERGPFGREASWAGGGILSPLYPWRYADAISKLAHYSQQHYPTLMQRLVDETSTDPEWRQCGMLMLDVRDLDAVKTWSTQFDSDLQFVDKDFVLRQEPELVQTSEQSAVWMPNVAQVRNPRFIKAMQTYLRQQQVTLLTDFEVGSLIKGADRVIGVVAKDGRSLEADHVVVANGAWSSQIFKQVQIDLQIHPVRGQMLMLQPGKKLLNSIILCCGHYLIPRADNQIIVGSTVEYAGFDKSTTEEGFAQLHRFATFLFPQLANAEVTHHWAGLRPGCGDGIPYISQHPSLKGLYINAGHFRNGIVMALGSAELLANLIFNEQAIVDPQPYSLERLTVDAA